MKMKFKSIMNNVRHSLTGAGWLLAGLLPAASAPAQNLYVGAEGNVYDVGPGGARTSIATWNAPVAMTEDSAGNLFVADGNQSVYEITPGGAPST